MQASTKDEKEKGTEGAAWCRYGQCIQKRPLRRCIIPQLNELWVLSYRLRKMHFDEGHRMCRGWQRPQKEASLEN